MQVLTRARLAALSAVLLASCSTSSHVLVGTPRPPISPDAVQVYMQPPARYEPIASINASSSGSFAITSQQNMDKALARMKDEAAKLGANGILLQGVHDQQSGSIGLGGGSSSYGPSSSSGVGLGGSMALTNKAATGLAIYVPPGQPPAGAPLPAPPPGSPPPMQEPLSQPAPGAASPPPPPPQPH
jgi:hypothetical protein